MDKFIRFPVDTHQESAVAFLDGGGTLDEDFDEHVSVARVARPAMADQPLACQAGDVLHESGAGPEMRLELFDSRLEASIPDQVWIPPFRCCQAPPTPVFMLAADVDVVHTQAADLLQAPARRYGGPWQGR